MGINECGSCVETRIGDSPDADLAIVAGDVFEQPIDRVVSVAALIDLIGIHFVGDLRPNIFEVPFGHPPASDILIHKDVPFGAEEWTRTQIAFVLVDSIGLAAIRRPSHEEGILLRLILRDIDRREELLAVPHRNAVLELGVVRFDLLQSLCEGRCWLTAQAAGQSDEQQGHGHEATHDGIL